MRTWCASKSPQSRSRPLFYCWGNREREKRPQFIPRSSINCWGSHKVLHIIGVPLLGWWSEWKAPGFWTTRAKINFSLIPRTWKESYNRGHFRLTTYLMSSTSGCASFINCSLIKFNDVYVRLMSSRWPTLATIRNCSGRFNRRPIRLNHRSLELMRGQCCFCQSVRKWPLNVTISTL